MNTFTLLSILIAIITPIIGVISVFRGEYRPQRMTRFLVLIITGIIFVSLLLQDAGAGFYLAGVQFIGACIYFGLSFKYGMGGTSGFDIIVLIGVICVGVIWYLTRDSFVALILSIIIDTIAFLPTFIKTWKHPYTESWPFYGCDVAAAIVSLVALGEIFQTHAIFPWYVFALNLTMVIIIVSRRKVLPIKHQ